MSHISVDQDSKAKPDSQWKIAFSYFTFSLVLGQTTGILSALYGFWYCSRFGFIGPYSWDLHRCWTPIVSDMVLAVILLILASPIAIIFRRKSFNFIYPGTTTFFLISGLLLSTHKINILATILLSLGLAIQVGRNFQNSPTSILKACRRIAPVGCSLILIAAATILGIRSQAERISISKLPDAPRHAPDILFIVWDTVRADYVGTFNDSGVPTPNLDKLAAHGTVFQRAVAPASWTLPSHASMFTGQFPHNLSADWMTPIPDEREMLAEVLSDHGYLTSGFVANIGYCGRNSGVHQGFSHFEDYKLTWKNVILSNFYLKVLLSRFAIQRWPHQTESKTGQEVTRDFQKWKERPPQNRPSFTFLNYMDAHTPYLPKKIHSRPLTQYEVTEMLSYDQKSPEEISDRLIKLAVTCYRAQIHALDRELGKILNFLKQRNELQNTVVIVASDHGEQFGEHEHYYHGNSLYQSVVHVPLVICDFRQAQASDVVERPISLRNIGATVLEFAGINSGHSIRGTSLIQMASTTTHAKQQDVVYGFNSMEALKDPRYPNLPFMLNSIGWKGRLDLWIEDSHSFIRGPGQQSELYDLTTDPTEQNEISSEKSAKASKLNSQLESFLDK
ncbi:MAG: sulfatase [Planctomycetaceae bacterium]|nr:sulfatase [Planctomycetaceae bacterium]